MHSVHSLQSSLPPLHISCSQILSSRLHVALYPALIQSCYTRSSSVCCFGFLRHVMAPAWRPASASDLAWGAGEVSWLEIDTRDICLFPTGKMWANGCRNIYIRAGVMYFLSSWVCGACNLIYRLNTHRRSNCGKRGNPPRQTLGRLVPSTIMRITLSLSRVPRRQSAVRGALLRASGRSRTDSQTPWLEPIRSVATNEPARLTPRVRSSARERLKASRRTTRTTLVCRHRNLALNVASGHRLFLVFRDSQGLFFFWQNFLNCTRLLFAVIPYLTCVYNPSI